MIRIKFQQSLDELKERLLVMAGLVEQAIQRATEAYSSRDEGLCELVKLSEPAINRMEREIDQLALDLLAMEQANVDLPVDIPRLAQLAGAMVRRALQAFIEGDAKMAESVLLLDDQVDDMNRDAFRSLGALIKDHPELAPQCLNALIISRNLERVGDHATNIAEDVIFWVRGADVRHHATDITNEGVN
jgi:phosphate transport system protein